MINTGKLRHFQRIAILVGLMAVLVFVASLEAAKNAEPKVDSYIVVMELDPAIAYEGEIAGLPATKPAEGKKINPNSARVKNYERFLEKGHVNSLVAAGASVNQKVNDYTMALNGYSALLTEDQVKELESQDGVLLVLKDELRQLTTDSSPDFLGLTGPASAWQTGYTGEGVIVGVIDSGIWPEHPSFADDGSYAPLNLTLVDTAANPLCNFGNTAQNPNDAPFTCNNKLIGARQMLSTYRAIIGADPDEYDSARDDDGHGTHTASTAAGNAGVQASLYGIPRGTISGIAPRARVIAYKGLGNLGGFTSDLVRAIDQAVADGVDVINYSVGGGASLTGGDDIAYLFAANAGVFVATSAGNSGPGPGTIGGPASVPWITSVGANTQSRTFQGTVILGDGSQYTGASITSGVGSASLVDAANVGGDLCVPGTLDSGQVAGKIVLCRRGAIARAAKSLAVLQAGGVGMIMYENSDAGSLFSDTHWVPSVHIDNTPGLAIKAYIASTADPTAEIVGEQLGVWPWAPSMTEFSSRGPNPVALDIIKPDITAPGIQILAGNSPTPDPGSYPGELFQAIAGTSMSSPHIAGIFALIKQAHPDWSAAMAKSAIMTTANRSVVSNNRISQATPFEMGAGHVNPGQAVHKGSAFQPGLVYDAGLFEYAAFTCGLDLGVFSPGSCAFLAGLGVPSDPSDLNLPSIGVAELAGSQTVQRTVTSVAQESGWREYTVSVDAPAGYSVSVNPSTIRLKKGQSATYFVTITNESAPIGEWRFGSMTWNDKTGNYAVTSPIAVRGALFSAPAEVNAGGESGVASFNIDFGYTGSYSAAAHGLVAATETVDNVLQDANQTFSPADVGTGGANLHQFNLSGAAFFRVAIPPEATEANADLDVFVFNPSGSLVASSTLGGTDEQVDILLPADGTWSVYVHGWSAPGGDSDYTMYSWVVSATPGGNLTIDSAPTAAAIGTSPAVNVSWSGATAGQWHLGAVSHTGDAGLMGLTLVNVDNR